MDEPKKTDMKQMKKKFFKKNGDSGINNANTEEVIDNLPLISGFECGTGEREIPTLREKRYIHDLKDETDIPKKFRDITILGYERDTANRTISTANFIFRGYSAWRNVPIYAKGFLKKNQDKALIILDDLDKQFGLHDGKYVSYKPIQTSEGLFNPGQAYFLIGPRPVKGEIHLLNIKPKENTCDIILVVPNFIKYDRLDESISGGLFSQMYELSRDAQLNWFERLSEKDKQLLQESGIVNLEDFKKTSQRFSDNLRGSGIRSEQIQQSLEDNLTKYNNLTDKVSGILEQAPDLRNQTISMYGY